jgi:hypothetical protein
MTGSYLIRLSIVIWEARAVTTEPLRNEECQPSWATNSMLDGEYGGVSRAPRHIRSRWG